MENKYWNRCRIVRVISNPLIPGYEEWLLVDNEDSSFRFEVFASCCSKFMKDGHFNFEKFNNGKDIKIELIGDYVANWNYHIDNEFWNEGFIIMKNASNDEKYFALGKVVDEKKREKIVKSRNLFIYFIDKEEKTKKGDNVLVSIYGVIDIE